MYSFKGFINQFLTPGQSYGHDSKWYSLNEFPYHKHAAPVYKATAVASILQIKAEPWLHTVIVGDIPATIAPESAQKQQHENLAITYIWDTRKIVDARPITTEMYRKIQALREHDKSVYANDNHELLKDTDKLETVFDKLYELVKKQCMSSRSPSDRWSFFGGIDGYSVIARHYGKFSFSKEHLLKQVKNLSSSQKSDFKEFWTKQHIELPSF